MSTHAYLRTIFAIIEAVISAEMTAQGRGVVENYLNSAGALDYSEKARYAIFRYAQVELPNLEDIRAKNKTRIRSTSAVPHCISSGAFGSWVASTKRW